MPTGKPLDGLVVLDFTHAAAGPMCSMLLADFGAKVIKVEKPGRGDHARHMTMLGMKDYVTGADYYLSLNRNKQSVAIDLATDEGRKLALELAKRSDVLVANFRPGVLQRLGLEYEKVQAINPRIIHCEITAFGTKGPRAQDPGMDLVAQALAGTIAITGEVGGPPMRPGPAVADLSGSLQATIGILLALQARHKTGKGQKVEVNLVDSALMMLSNLAASTLNWDVEVKKFGQGHPQLAPYQGFRSKDGWVFIACGTNRLWRDLCKVLDMEHLLTEPRFKGNPDRVMHMKELEAILSPIFAGRTTEAWLPVLKAGGVPAAPVLKPHEGYAAQAEIGSQIVGVVDHPTLGKLKLPGISIKLSDTPASIDRYPPRLGEDTSTVLKDFLGYSDERIAGLEKQNVVSTYTKAHDLDVPAIAIPRRK